jgi:hypothetical protein
VTKMTTIPDNDNNIRAGIVELLKAARSATARNVNSTCGHWMKAGENPPVGLILRAEKGAAQVHYALDNLPNKVLAAEYQTVLPDEKLIANELKHSRRELEKRASAKVRHLDE